MAVRASRRVAYAPLLSMTNVVQASPCVILRRPKAVSRDADR